MTLRFRLLLVYLMVVLLAAATVGVALVESRHATRIYGALLPCNDIMIAAQKLGAALSSPADLATASEQDRFFAILTEQYIKLSEAGNYRDVDPVRMALNELKIRFQQWCALPADRQAEQIETLRDLLDRYARQVDDLHARLKDEADLQETRQQVLLSLGISLTVLYLVVFGSLLRRWLLKPMERLNRQVEALGRDEPPPEPLLSAPLELANLARALERARQSLGSLRQQLVESERLTTIGQLAAQLAHNLRNPLASIRAAAQFTARHGPPEADAAERLAGIIASVDRMNRWIAGLMEIAKEHPTLARLADVVPTLRRVAEAVAPDLAARELTLALDVPPDGLLCRHDPDTLEHTLVAVVVNAIEASPLGGTIQVRAERLDATGPERPIGVECGPGAGPSAGGAWCRISVIDRGPGLPPDDPERIFEYSYSTKQRGMGLGLGLARQALRRQGGRAGALNNPGGGATVYVELPIDDSPDSV